MQHFADQVASLSQKQIAEKESLIQHLNEIFSVILKISRVLWRNIWKYSIELVLSQSQSYFSPYWFLHETSPHKGMIRPMQGYRVFIIWNNFMTKSLIFRKGQSKVSPPKRRTSP